MCITELSLIRVKLCEYVGDFEPVWTPHWFIVPHITKNYIQDYLFDVEMCELISVPLDNLSPTLSYSVTPSTSYFPWLFPAIMSKCEF